MVTSIKGKQNILVGIRFTIDILFKLFEKYLFEWSFKTIWSAYDIFDKHKEIIDF